MPKELIIFMDDETVTVYRKKENEYVNEEIRGEVFYYYEKDEIDEIPNYLLNIFSEDDFENFRIKLIAYENETTEELLKNFAKAQVEVLPYETFTKYIKDAEIAFNKTNAKAEEKLNKALKKNKELKKELKKITEEKDALKKQLETKIASLKKGNKLSKTKTEKRDVYYEGKNKLKRSVIYVNKKHRIWELKLIKTTRRTKAQINISNKIGEAHYYNSFTYSDQPQKIIATLSGYLYWLAEPKNKEITCKDLISKRGKYAVAVISSSPDENLDELREYAKKQK